jgi:hypothetical protein
MNWLKNVAKFILIFLILCSCSWRKSGENLNASVTETAAENLQTKELATFQTDLILITFLEDKPKERKILIAKDGDKRLVKFHNKAWLQIDKKIFLLDYNRRVFVEIDQVDEDRAFSTDGVDSLSEMVTFEFLNKRFDSKIQKISTEEGISKYLVTLENSNKSEILVSYDEDKRIIITQEFFSIRDKDRKLLYKMELRNWSSEVSPENFKFPEGFRKVKLEEF